MNIVSALKRFVPPPLRPSRGSVSAFCIERVAPVSIIALILASTFYAWRFSYFWLDDFTSLYWTERVSGWQILWFNLNPLSTFFRPFGMLFYWIFWNTFDLNPLPYHLFAWGLYTANVALLYTLVLRIADSSYAAAVGALLFSFRANFTELRHNFRTAGLFSDADRATRPHAGDQILPGVRHNRRLVHFRGEVQGDGRHITRRTPALRHDTTKERVQSEIAHSVFGARAGGSDLRISESHEYGQPFARSPVLHELLRVDFWTRIRLVFRSPLWVQASMGRLDDHIRYPVCVVYLSARPASVVFLRLCLCHSPASDISRKSSI